MAFQIGLVFFHQDEAGIRCHANDVQRLVELVGHAGRHFAEQRKLRRLDELRLCELSIADVTNNHQDRALALIGKLDPGRLTLESCAVDAAPAKFVDFHVAVEPGHGLRGSHKVMIIGMHEVQRAAADKHFGIRGTEQMGAGGIDEHETALRLDRDHVR